MSEIKYSDSDSDSDSVKSTKKGPSIVNEMLPPLAPPSLIDTLPNINSVATVDKSVNARLL